MTHKNITRFKLILIVALLFRLVFAFIVWHPDVNNHVDWGTRFWVYGFKGFYNPDSNVWSYTWPNQPPGTIYIFALLKKVSESIFNFFWFINIKVALFPSDIIFYLEDHLYPALLQLPSILADFGIAYLIYKNIKSRRLAKTGAILWLLNPVIWYNSSVWGQTDSVITFFVFLSFYLLIKNKPILSVLSYAISIYIKASLIIFIPLYLYYLFKKRYPLSKYAASFVVASFLIILLTIPFTDKNPVIWLFYLYQGKVFVQQLQVITANAFNIWATIASIHERPQTLMLGPLSYQVWGSLAFIIAYIAVVYTVVKNKMKNIFWPLSIVALASFMLLTNMHERYLYPFFPFFTILAVKEAKYMKVYIILSLINLLNLYNFWWVPKVDLIISFLSFGNRLMPRILGLIGFGIFIYLFKQFLRQVKPSRI